MGRGMRRQEERKRREKEAREKPILVHDAKGLLYAMCAECGIPSVLQGQHFACVTVSRLVAL